MNIKIIIDPILPVTFEINGPKPTLPDLRAAVGNDDIELVPRFFELEPAHINELKTMFVGLSRNKIASGRRNIDACTEAWRALDRAIIDQPLTTKTCIAYCGEHGKMRGMDENLDATWLWGKVLGLGFGEIGDILVGPVIILCGATDWID